MNFTWCIHASVEEKAAASSPTTHTIRQGKCAPNSPQQCPLKHGIVSRMPSTKTPRTARTVQYDQALSGGCITQVYCSSIPLRGRAVFWFLRMRALTEGPRDTWSAQQYHSTTVVVTPAETIWCTILYFYSSVSLVPGMSNEREFGVQEAPQGQ